MGKRKVAAGWADENVVQFNSTKRLLERITDLENELDMYRNPNTPTPASNAPIAVNLPEGVVPQGDLGFEDIGAAFNMRDWLQKACEDAGAVRKGGGFGFGEADLDIELEGHMFNVTIKPLSRS